MSKTTVEHGGAVSAAPALSAQSFAPGLYLVPTPIGNLQDITLRAIAVLKAATLVAAEDTRHSRILLDHLGIRAPKLNSLYDQVEERKAGIIIEEVRQGGIVALISDAGSPLINDPGYKLVSLCLQAHVAVIPLPGPCALITALEAAALPTDAFTFKGFFPVKEQELRACIAELAERPETMVFYESPRRVLKTCEILAELLPGRQICLCRELTKSFESFYRMSSEELPDFLRADPQRTLGEFVVVIAGASHSAGGVEPEIKEALAMLLKTTPLKAAVAALSLCSKARPNELYALALTLKQSAGKES